MSSDIASRARSGTKVLALRNAVTQVLRIGSSVVVARWLSPEDFGLFAVLIYISGLPMYIQGLGLSGALIQQREEPTEEQWSSAFFLQLTLAVALFVSIVVFGPFLLKLFGVPSAAYALLVAAALPSLISAFSFYQSVWLQRHLEFRKFATAAFASDIVSIVFLCFFAIAGFGVWTLVLAPVLAGATLTAGLFFIRPWRPQFVLRFSSLRRLLSVGIPMQVNVTMPASLDGWVPFYTGRILGIEALGFMNLAQRLAAMPASYLQILNQVALPSFSRLQDNADELMARLGNVLHRLAVLCGCCYVVFAPWIPDLVNTVYGERWRFAGHLMQYLGIGVVLIAMTGVIGPALNALGRHWLRTFPILIGYLLVWSFAPMLIKGRGVDGLGLAFVSLSSMQLLGSLVCLPRTKAGRGKVITVVAVAVGLGLAAAFALTHTLSLGFLTVLTISIGGLLLTMAVHAVESRAADTTTFHWLLRMLKPQPTRASCLGVARNT